MSTATAPPTAASEAAKTAVFDPAELLENILLQLPMRTLLHAQRVSKTWQAAIANSSRLQEALFFKPIAVMDYYYDWGRELWVNAVDEKPVIIYRNPLFPITMDSKTFNSLSGSSASYNKMFVSQPALERIRVDQLITGIRSSDLNKGLENELEDEGVDVYEERKLYFRDSVLRCSSGVTGRTLVEHLEEPSVLPHQERSRTITCPLDCPEEPEHAWRKLTDNAQLQQLNRSLKNR